MRSVPLAMTWELLHHGRWQMLLGLLGANLFPVLILTALRIDGAIDPTDQAFVTMQAVLVQMSAFMFGAGILSTQSNSSRMYTLPVRTSTLVAWRMFPAMVLMALQSVIWTSMINALYGLDWPLWAPALFSAVALAAIQSALWYSEKSPLLPLFVGFAGGTVGLWYKSHCGPIFANPTQIWKDVSPGDAATLTLLVGVSFVAASIGVARNRCGEPLGKQGLIAWIESWMGVSLEISARRTTGFQTRLDAQFWSEWSKKGWMLPVPVSFSMVIWFAVWVIFVRDPKELIVGLVAGGALLSVMGMIGGLIIGNCGSTEANLDVGQFLGTRPISNVDLAWTMLKVAAQSVLYSWLIWFVTSSVVVALLAVTGVSAVALLPAEVQWWYLPATLLGCWIFVGLLTSVTLTGRGQLLAQVVSTVLLLSIASMLFSKLLTWEMQAWLTSAALFAAGSSICGGVLWTMVAAIRQSLISSKVVAISGCVWMLLTIVVIYECWRQPVSNAINPIVSTVAAAMFFTGVASLVVVPFAAAPLAIKWNRHR